MIIASGTTIPRTDLRSALVEFMPDVVPIGGLLYPWFEVPDQTGYFGRVPKESTMGIPNTDRSTDGSYNRQKGKLEDDSWATRERGMEEPLDNRQARLFRNYIDYERVRAIRLASIMARVHEQAVVAAVHNTTTYTQSGNTGLAVTNEWDDNANCVPIDDVHAGLRGIRARCGLTADTLQIAWRTAFDLSRSSQILDRLKYTSQPPGLLPTTELAAALGIKRVIVGNQPYNTANDGVAETIGELWDPEYAFLAVTAAGMDIEANCVGRTMYWNEDGSAGPEPLFEEYVEDRVRSSVLRVRHEWVLKTLDSSCGFLFSNIKT